MKQMMLILDFDDSFEPGCCNQCPIAIADDDYDYYCPICGLYNDCPLIDKDDYDCMELDK